jgi:hypothetical protein
MSAEESKAIVRRGMEARFTHEGNLGAVDDRVCYE